MPPIDKTCEYCGSAFRGRPNQLYCTTRCRRKVGKIRERQTQLKDEAEFLERQLSAEHGSEYVDIDNCRAWLQRVRSELAQLKPSPKPSPYERGAKSPKCQQTFTEQLMQTNIDARPVSDTSLDIADEILGLLGKHDGEVSPRDAIEAALSAAACIARGVTIYTYPNDCRAMLENVLAEFGVMELSIAGYPFEEQES